MRPLGEQLESRELLTVGLDPTFGFSGTALLAYNPNPSGGTQSQSISLTAIALQSNGQIVAVGTDDTSPESGTGTFTENLVVARFNSDGSVDTSFGTSGLVQIPVKVAGTAVSVSATGIALQSNGDIIVGGTAQSTPEEFVVARVTPSGAIDTSFGGSGTGYNLITFEDPGTTPANQPIDASMTGLTVAPSGNIDAVGDVDTVKGGPDIAVAQLVGSSGVLDTSFNGTGENIYNLFTSAAGLTSADQANAIVDQSNNQLVIVGSISEPVPVTTPVTPAHQVAVALRINSNGSVDTSFGGSNTGFILIPFNLDSSSSTPITETANAVAIDPSTGKIVGTGFAEVSPETSTATAFTPEVDNATVFRLNTNGTLDTSFNGTGKQSLPLSVGGNTLSTTGQTVAVLGDSSILIGGDFNGAGAGGGFLAKLTPTGQLATSDPDYGPSGFTLLSDNDVTDLVVQPDGKVVFVSGSGAQVSRTTAPTAAVAASGVVLKGKQPKKGAKFNGIAIRFNTALLSAMSTNPNGYIVKLGKKVQKVKSVTYNPSTFTLTLLLKSAVTAKSGLTVTIAAGGAANANAQVLNNGAPLIVTVPLLTLVTPTTPALAHH